MRRGFHHHAGTPPGEHPWGDVGEQLARQADRPGRAQFADLGEHRLQADVARHRLDQRQHRVLAGAVVRDLDRDQRAQPIGDVGGKPGRDPRGQRLLSLVQRRAHDPADPPSRRRLNPLRPAPSEQLIADQLRAPFGLAHVRGEPLSQIVRVSDRALPEAQMGPDLRPVVLDRAARPLVQPEHALIDANLPSHELDRFARYLATAARKPAGPNVELQQQREPEPRRPALARDQLSLVIQQRPMLDQLIEIQRSRHNRTSCRTRPQAQGRPSPGHTPPS
jgi:hypothetical protein